MANISEAYGTIFACAENEEILESILRVIKCHYRYEYYTEADSCEILFREGKYCFETFFFAYGRSSYRCNVENLFRWPWEELDELPKEEKEQLLKDFDLLDKESFEICIDFTECERGMDLLCEETIELNKEKGQKVINAEGKCPWEISCTQRHETSPENLYRFGFIINYYQLDELEDLRRFLSHHKEAILAGASENYRPSEEFLERVLTNDEALRIHQEELLASLQGRSTFEDFEDFNSCVEVVKFDRDELPKEEFLKLPYVEQLRVVKEFMKSSDDGKVVSFSLAYKGSKYGCETQVPDPAENLLNEFLYNENFS